MSEENLYKKYEPLFGSWYITGQIGQGAIGRVFEIERTEIDTTYRAALKAITIPESPDDVKRVLSSGVAKEDLHEYYRELIRNIANEFRYLARLKGNSYIVNYEDHQIIESKDEMKWDVLIKMELLMPLVEYVTEHPMNEDDVLRLGIDICSALSFCGRYNMLHRDIKPENIFIAPSGNFKLGDFGIARVVEETYVNLSRKGTYTYMAPEVFHGRKYDQTADLYSLGLVMYKYLNHGRIPFMPEYPSKISYDDTEKAFSERMSGRALPEPANASTRLRRIVLKACAYDPENRYENADDMLADLEELYVSLHKKHRSRIKKRRSINANDAAAGPASAQNEAKRSKLQKTSAAIACILATLALAIYISIPKAVTDISGIDNELSMYYDDELKPEYRVEPSWFRDEPISFKSGNEDVFTVTKDGSLEAVATGEADLTMKVKEYSETVHVSVVPKVTKIKNIEGSYALTAGDTAELKPTLEPEEFSDEPVSYRSSDKSVASVSKDGTVTAKAAGEAIITVSAGGTETTAEISVTEPVVYAQSYSSGGTSSKSSGSSRKSTKKRSSGSSKGYFGDAEYF